MDRTAFHYDLPRKLIAQHALPERSASRLLVLNDTRVIRARLQGRKATGGQVEMLLERITGARGATAQIKAGRSPRAGAVLTLANGASATVLGRDGPLFELAFSSDVEPLLQAHGEVPLPPYIRRNPADEDLARYQTVYAREIWFRGGSNGGTAL